jgi:molybdopterin/thiamine biosynthesis adenylyltransferase
MKPNAVRAVLDQQVHLRMALVLSIIIGVSTAIFFKIPRGVIMIVLAIAYGAILVAHFILPVDAPILVATSGGDIRVWGALGGAVVIIAAYGVFLRQLKRKANQSSGPAIGQSGTFSDTELERYARHIVLREIGGVGQKRLKNARVLVIGAGGLGAPALQYLAAAGVGTIGVIDDDIVENANLQRQVIHHDAAIGTPKVFSAQKIMTAQNPFITVLPFHRRLTADIAHDLFSDFDVILEGSDNFETRYLANETAVALGKPLVSGALSQWEGQISVFHPATHGPCYQCVFPQKPAEGMAPSCAQAGVFAPLPGVIGAMMAGEALKLIIGEGQALIGEMLIYDALYGEIRKFTIKQRHDCPVCGHKD